MRYNIIAIEREFASGGREIGEKLAEKLGIPCYGQEILEKAAEKLRLPLTELRGLEEKMTGSLLFSLTMLANITSGKGADLTTAQKLALTETDVIRELALNPCVIVGRSAAGLFKDKDKAFKAFIHADYSKRLERAVNIYGYEEKQAESILHRYDRRRIGYFRTAAGVEWKDENVYHMFLNSGKLGIDRAVDILHSAVE